MNIKLVVLLLSLWTVLPVWSAPTMALRELAGGFASPIALVPLPGGSGRLLVADQAGTITELSGGGATQPFLNLTERLVKVGPAFDERGLLGLALHPRFAENGRLFVFYSAPLQAGAPKDWNHTAHLSEFKSTQGKVDPASERVLLKLDEPFFNHNGGCLVFGPDGYLYVGVGDGGNANDQEKRAEQGNGQDTSTLHGSILRLDIDKGDPYGIPPENPFAKGGGCPEIFAFGLRNPWRLSFDRGGEHGLLAADIGQNKYEEVNQIVRGGNYGWNIREGFHCFDPKNPNTTPESCPKVDAAGRALLDPVFEYKNRNGFRNDPEALGISITGGYVYRGKALPKLQGRYVFGDWSMAWPLPMGRLFVATPSKAGSGDPWKVEPLNVSADGGIGRYITAFGEDHDGELYVLTSGRNSLSGDTGKVFKLVPAEP